MTRTAGVDLLSCTLEIHKASKTDTRSVLEQSCVALRMSRNKEAPCAPLVGIRDGAWSRGTHFARRAARQGKEGGNKSELQRMHLY